MPYVADFAPPIAWRTLDTGQVRLTLSPIAELIDSTFARTRSTPLPSLEGG